MCAGISSDLPSIGTFTISSNLSSLIDFGIKLKKISMLTNHDMIF